ncbi:MAG TPA: biotin/lipoyl-containing protein [Gemmatimonadaceae bacterium]|nr:biotin/lipoyl-containing protein [Gemmatimonadaceae bacterium]
MKYVVELNGIRKAVSLDADGVAYETEPATPAELSDVEGSPIRTVKLGTHVYRVVVERREGRGRYTLWIDGYRFDVEALDERTRAIRELSRANAAATGPAPIKAPMPGLIVRVNVKEGEVVEAGQGVVVMEAMKMENELRATAGGTVRSVDVVPGQAVEKGALLVVLE